MEIDQIKLSDLKAGSEYTYVTRNADDCLAVDIATIRYSAHLGKILVWLNGRIMGSYKNLRSATAMLLKLTYKHRLEFDSRYQMI